MAAHVRTQIREAIADFVTGLPTTQDRVFESRVYPLEETDLPALRVYSKDEAVQILTIHAPALQSRRLQIVVEGVAQATADLDDTLDQICKEVEIAISTATLGTMASNIVLQTTTTDMDGTTAQPRGVATLTFEVEYMTAENAPDVAL